MKNYKTIIALVAAGLTFAATTSKATLTFIGPVTDTTSLSGVQNLDSTYNISTVGGPLAGHLYSWVLPTDTFAPTGYNGATYVYQLNETGSDQVNLLTVLGFGNAGNIQVGYSGTGVAPTGASITGAGSVNINFNLFTGLTDYLYVYTTAATSPGVPNNAFIQDDGQAQAQALAPVPEPSTVVAGALMLLPFGIGAIRSLRKDRTA